MAVTTRVISREVKTRHQQEFSLVVSSLLLQAQTDLCHVLKKGNNSDNLPKVRGIGQNGKLFSDIF
jgi:hypothetical protein